MRPAPSRRGDSPGPLPATPPGYTDFDMDIAERICRALVERGDVRLVYLFGSTAAGTARRSSDADIAILFDEVPAPGVLDLLTERLEAAADRPVDLVVLNDASPLLAREVIARGRLLLCRDDQDRVRFETRTTARYQDTAHLRGVQYAYLRERAEAHRAGPR
jgi:predicted nucleotidyltransferase